MTNTTTTANYVGQVVWATDRHHRGRRPHLVVAMQGDALYLAELTHSPQGAWTTDELPSRRTTDSYLALTDWRTGEWMPTWHRGPLQPYRRQLSERTADQAVAYVDRCYQARR